MFQVTEDCLPHVSPPNCATNKATCVGTVDLTFFVRDSGVVSYSFGVVASLQLERLIEGW
jgi:hypothetical protein